MRFFWGEGRGGEWRGLAGFLLPAGRPAALEWNFEIWFREVVRENVVFFFFFFFSRRLVFWLEVDGGSRRFGGEARWVLFFFFVDCRSLRLVVEFDVVDDWFGKV